MYLDETEISRRELEGHYYRDKISDDSYNNTLILYDFIVSYYQVISLLIDDVSPD